MSESVTKKQKTNDLAQHAVAKSHEEWLEARMKLLEKEKEMAKLRKELNAQRQELPWEEESRDYKFVHADGACDKEVGLKDMFPADESELIVYHLMFGNNEDSSACSLCSFFIDQLLGGAIHLPKGRVRLAVLANAPATKLLELAKRKGWFAEKSRPLELYSCTKLDGSLNTFGADYGVHWTKEQVEKKECVYNYNRTWEWGGTAPGISVFRLQNDKVYHTYSTYSAGLADVSVLHDMLDITPSGRDEDGGRNMHWVKHKEDYPVPTSGCSNKSCCA